MTTYARGETNYFTFVLGIRYNFLYVPPRVYFAKKEKKEEKKEEGSSDAGGGTVTQGRQAHNAP